MATTNAVNLHDGMDGLASGTCILILCTMAAIFAQTRQFSLSFLSLIVVASLVAFFFYNRNPAKIFMGDTGSLFLGGLLAALALAGGTLLWFVPLTAIYIAEVISVFIQTTYFKLTKPYTPDKPMSTLALIKVKWKLKAEGKRYFRMAPLHHHFEMVLAERGVKEKKVVGYFWLAQALICLVVWLACQVVWIKPAHSGELQRISSSLSGQKAKLWINIEH
jgi:phospho-N-acetylmuramoyl-pentapeptide-transferase